MKFKKLSIIVVLITVLIAPFKNHGAFKLSDTFDFYGFIKFDAFYQDGGMNHIIASRYATPGDGNLALTAMNTRFGIKLKGREIGSGWRIAGQFEIDLFDGSSPNIMKIRTRHANVTLTKGKTQLLFGQFWDVFAPMNPLTLNTNGNLWQTGNIGFRRTQARFTYTSANIFFAVSLNDPTTAESRKSQLPLLQSRVGLKLGEKGKIKVGLSGAFGKEKEPTGRFDDVHTIGICADWKITLSKFSIMGEFTTGHNLGIFLSKGKVYEDEYIYEGQDAIALWAEIVYKIKKTNFWGGFAFEKLTDDNTLNAGKDYKDVSCFFAGVKLIAGKGISLGLEFTHYISKLFKVEDNLNTNQLIASFIYDL